MRLPFTSARLTSAKGMLKATAKVNVWVGLFARPLSRLPRRKKETIEQCHPPSLGCDTCPGVIARPRRREASGGGINGCILGDISLPATSPPGGGSENPNQQRSNRFRPGCALSTIVPTTQSVRERDQPPRPPSTDTACRPQPPNHFRVFSVPRTLQPCVFFILV